MEEKLSKLLDDGDDWEKLETSIRGIAILKVPGYKGKSPRLAVEINPIDELGRTMKKRGLILRSSKELEAFMELLSHDKLTTLFQNIDKICGKIEKEKKEVIEL